MAQKSHTPMVAVKRLSYLAAASAFFVLANPAVLADEWQVDQYKTQQVTQADITLNGYITGSLNSSGTAYQLTNTNLALGQTVDVQAADTVPVQLPKALRDQYSLVNHPELQGQYVSVTGTSATYMNKAGVKNTSSITVLTDNSPVAPTQQASNSDSVEATESEETLTPATGATPIAQVREEEQSNTYTVAGKIISKVNAWGGQGFYIQDDSGQGLYVYPKKDLGFKEGDSVQVTGTLTAYHGELQLGSVTDSRKVSDNYATTTTTVSLDGLETAPQATMVTVSDVTVEDMSSDSYNNTDMTVVDALGNKVSVRVDSRSGLQAANLFSKIGNGDTITLTAVLSTYDGRIQLKPFAESQFVVTKKATVAAGSDEVTVAEIQGKSHRSPYANRPVTVKNVVVSYVTSDTNFYVQDLTPDGDLATSDGINVFSGKAATKTHVKVGDVLELRGTVEEYFGKGYEERKQTDLTITQLSASNIKVVGTADAPKPVVIGKDRVIPAGIIENDAFDSFDPNEDALDFWESVEGMLVEVDDAKILGPMKNKEIYVVPGDSDAHFNKVGGVSLEPDTQFTQRVDVLLKSGKTPVKSGDYFTGAIVGPVTYSYTNYKVYVDDATLPELHDGGVMPEKTTIVKDPNQLTIASYNIENFSADPSSTKDSKVERIAKSFVSDLNAPDIVGLIEVQDNNGPKDDGTVDATASANRLIAAIKAQGGPSYQFVSVNPVNNADGGQAGANIRLGFLYNPERVSLADKPQGGSMDSVAWKDGELTYSVGRIDATDPLWDGVRKSIAGEFIFNGEKVVVIANHLNSKRGDNGLYGSIQPAILGSEEKRHQLAQVIANFAKEGLTQNPDANIVMLGDYNDYEFTPTIKIIESAGLTDVVSLHDEADRFSYFYNGNNQTLDHMIVSNNLLNRYQFDMVHVNSAFMEEHGRASDHDPVMIQLNLAKTPDLENVTPVNPSQPVEHTPAPDDTVKVPVIIRETPVEVPEETEQSVSQAPSTTVTETIISDATSAEKVLPKTGQANGAALSVLGGFILSVTSLVYRKSKEHH